MVEGEYMYRVISRREFTKASLATMGLAAVGKTCDAAFASQESPAQEIVIFHTNDMHGYLVGNGKSVIGADYVSALKNSVPNALLVDAGDEIQGSPFASLTKGEDCIEVMNKTGYDAMCLGNHEFDYGIDILLDRAAAAGFPMLSANVINSEGIPVTANTGCSGNGASAVLECGGRRIGVFGLTTNATAWSVLPDVIQGITFIDEIKTAEAQIAELAQQNVDAIICLAHLGDNSVPCEGTQLAQYLSDEAASKLTAIIDGHSHSVENTVVHGIAVVQTGCYLSAVGKLTLNFGNDVVSCTEELLELTTVINTTQPNDEVTQELDRVSAGQQKILSAEICLNPTTLWAGQHGSWCSVSSARIVESNYGDLVCESYLYVASEYLKSIGADDAAMVSVMNGGNSRDILTRGMLTKGDLVSISPYANTVMIKRVTPAFLKGVFEFGFSNCNGQDIQTGMLLQKEAFSNFMQTSGLTVVVDANMAVGSRVVSITLDGASEPLDLTDDQTPIILVSNSFVMTGGYTPLADVELVAEIGGILEALEKYIAYLNELNNFNGLPLLTGTKGNILFRTEGFEPAPTWTAKITLADNTGQPLANTSASIQIDSGDSVDVTSDEQGFVSIELEDGPHSLAIMPPEDTDPATRIDETYVNNYVGYGLVQNEMCSWPVITM